MQNHPLTPMTDPNLVRVLQAQCRGKVGLIDYSDVARGEDAIRRRIDELRAQGTRIAIVDAISNDDLLRLGPALKGMPLVTGGSGVAIGLAANFGIAPSGCGKCTACRVRLPRDRVGELLRGDESSGKRVHRRRRRGLSSRCVATRARQ